MLKGHPRRWRMGLLDDDYVKRPSCLSLPSVTSRWTITVAVDNYGEIIREYPRCIRSPLLKFIHFDTGHDAWWDQVNIHAHLEEPKLASSLVSRGQ
jgi:hypothetical protein